MHLVGQESSGAEAGAPTSALVLLERAGETYLAQPEQALALVEDALNNPATQAETARGLLLKAKILHQQGDVETALGVVAEANAYYSRHGEATGRLESTLLFGRLYRDLSRFDHAAEAFENALRLARQLEDKNTEADALNLLASVWAVQGNYPQALEHLEYVLALVRSLELPEQEANILNNIGTLHTLLGNYPAALEHLTCAHDLLQNLAIGYRNLASNLISLGQLYQDMGNADEASRFFAKVQEAGQANRDPHLEAVALNNLANIALQAGNYPTAQTMFEAALAITRSIGAREYELDNLDGLGQVYVALADFKRAAATHQTVLTIARELGDCDGELAALLNLGKDYLVLERADAACSCLEEGLSLAQTLQRQPSVVEAHELLSRAYEQSSDFAKALAHSRAFHAAEKTIFNEVNEQRTRELSVQFDLERSRHEAEEYRLRTTVLQQARDEAEAKVQARTWELEQAQLEIITRLAVAAEFRDDDTGEHTKRVGRNAAAIAYALGWADDEVQLLYTAARLHDVGKIGISDTILHKPGKLTPEETARMQTHTTIGARILSAGNSPLLELAEEIALAHHERWDGKGYPLGLKGEEIPLSARIVAVADVLDALIHERPYKHAWSVSEALAEIKRQRGFQFDPRVVDACLWALGTEGALSPLDSDLDWPTTLHVLKTKTPYPTFQKDAKS